MKKGIMFLLMLVCLVTLSFAQPWNTSRLDEAENLYEITLEMNTLLNGTIAVGIIITVFAISFTVTQLNTGSVINGLLSGSYIAAITALIFLPLGFIGLSIFTMVLLILGFSLAASYFLD